MYDHNGVPDPSVPGRKLIFPRLINDPVCYTTEILKGPFLKFFWTTKETKLVFNARKLSVGVGVFPVGERAQKTCIRMSDGYEIGSFSITS